MYPFFRDAWRKRRWGLIRRGRTMLVILSLCLCLAPGRKQPGGFRAVCGGLDALVAPA